MIETATRPELVTQRLRLRPLAMADAPRLAELGDDFEVARMLTSCPHPYALADAEALAASLRWVAGAWGRRCVTARHFVDNPASAAVLQRAGFLYTGRTEWRHCVSRCEAVLNRWMVWLA